MVAFYLKPRRRLWDPDGIDSVIEITTPKMVEVQRTKDLTQSEAQRRFGYLAEIVDSGGWAVRGAGVQAPNSAMTNDAYFAAQQVQDVLDIDSTASQTLSYKLDQSDMRRHQEAVGIMSQQPVAATVPNYFNDPTIAEPVSAPDPAVTQQFDYNPYPEEMRQSIVEPINVQPKQPTTTSEKVVSAGIMNLANNTDLSIETIAREANRINKKQDLDKEVIISLR